MRLAQITLREIHLPLVAPCETSFGETTNRRILLLEVTGEGSFGWGEVTAGETPSYNEEDTDTAWYILTRFVIPEIPQKPLSSAAVAAERFEHIRGHRMAIGGLEAALWDWEER